jgi:hypothetical protein
MKKTYREVIGRRKREEYRGKKLERYKSQNKWGKITKKKKKTKNRRRSISKVKEVGAVNSQENDTISNII